MEKETANKAREKNSSVKKTDKALYNALFTMLRRRSFSEITVNALCSEALISRATFYAHFSDKYDLLDYLLTEVRKNIIKDVENFDELEREVNQFVYINKKVIANVLRDANSETLALVRNFMSSIVHLMVKRNISDETSPHHIILYNFFIGGLLNLLTWIVEHDFPPEINMMSSYLYQMLATVTFWDAEQERQEIDIKN